MLVPVLTPESELGPLLIVLAVSAIKNAAEDYKRYKQDNKANQRVYAVIKDGRAVPTMSKDINPGNVLRLRNGDTVPSDVLCLSTSIYGGTCYVETAELDGETRLTRRFAVAATAGKDTDDLISQVSGRFQCEPPNANLILFDGRLRVWPSPGAREKVEPTTINNMLLRGMVLRNVDVVYGVAVFAGPDTRIMRNLKMSGLKFSTLEKRLNKLVLCIFAYNACLLVF
ncbi:MAG: hypothetical protein BJ554DRAFT_91, partial [Olpidium bornovanus]